MPLAQVFELYDGETGKLIASASSVEAINAAIRLLTRGRNGRVRPHVIGLRVDSEIR